MSYPFRIAIMWHQHQPMYKYKDEFLLPWTRFHAVKDYFDLPEILNAFPGINQTFNLVPSLDIQITEYYENKTTDCVQRLTMIDAADLNESQKKQILDQFFVCNFENLIKPYDRYLELFEKSRDNNSALLNFTTGDWRDLQAWYNLAWIGQFSREADKIEKLFSKGRYFSEEDKVVILNYHLDILRRIKSQYKSLAETGRAEISVSPKYHPILPLLCDSGSALESQPELILPDPVFRHHEDAEAQVSEAIKHYSEIFGRPPKGMWPSEGSLSDETLEILIKSGIKWAASDETVLKNTLGKDYRDNYKYFPIRFSSAGGKITLFFRDHFLSDRIGFVYSQWQPEDAAGDFCENLRNIKKNITEEFGEESLEKAVVPVILDGENCWEFYKDNGVPFLESLYSMLSSSDEFKTITFSEAAESGDHEKIPALDHVQAGSWINGNFNIWIGHEHDRKAWVMISRAREAVMQVKADIATEVFREAMEEIYIAEGSDWFWWYGDEHQAPNKDDFDVLFRNHIEKIYKIIGEKTPKDVFIPISKKEPEYGLKQQTVLISPEIDGRIKPAWDEAGYFDAGSESGAMHQVGEILKKLWFGSNEENVFFRIDLIRKLDDEDKIEINFGDNDLIIQFRTNGFDFDSKRNILLNNFKLVYKDIIEFGFSKGILRDVFPENYIKFVIKTNSKDGEIIYPRTGFLNFKIL